MKKIGRSLMLFPVLFLLIFSAFSAQEVKAEIPSQGGNTSPPPTSTDSNNPLAACKRTLDIGSFGVKVDIPHSIYRVVVDQDPIVDFDISYTGTSPVIGQDCLNTNTTAANLVPDPFIEGVYLGVNYSGVVPDCFPGYLATTLFSSVDCQNGDIISKATGQAPPAITDLPATGQKISVPFNLLKAATPTDDKPVTVPLVFFPIVALDYSNLDTARCVVSLIPSSGYGFCFNSDKGYTNNMLTVNIEVYKTPEQVDAAGGPVGGEALSGTGTNTSNPGDTKNPFATPIDFIATLFGTLILWAIEIFYTLFSLLIVPIIVAVLSINTYTDIFAAVILPGWEVLRNLSNIFFILVLLFVALGTIFRIEAFKIGIRQVVIRLMIAALLVNFSLVIGQSVLGIAETVQNQFLGSDVASVKKVAYDLAILPFTQQNNAKATASGPGSLPGYYSFQSSNTVGVSLSRLIFPLFFLGLAAATFIVLGGLAIMLLIRMVMVWILLMGSPMAYVAMVLPQTTRYTREWWSTLIKYAFFPAIIAFFLNITAYVLESSKGVVQSFNKNNQQLTDLQGFIFPVMTQISGLIFIVLGIGVAQKLGIVGGKTLANWGTKGLKLPLTLSKSAGNAAGNWATARAPILSPTFWKEGWAARNKKVNDKWREKADKSARKGLFGLSPALGLNNPEQLFNNFTTGELKKLLPGTLGTKFAAKHAKEKARGRAAILTDDERAAKDKEKNTLQAKKSDVEDRARSVGTSNDISKRDKAFIETQAILNARKISMEGELDNLRKQKIEADKKGDTTKSAELQGKIQDLNEKVQAYRDNMAEDNIHLQGIADHDSEVRDYLKKALEANSEETAEKIKKIDQEEIADDELRQKNNFSAYDHKTKGDPDRAADYREFTPENKRYLQQKAGEFEKAEKDRKFAPVWNERKETQAKVRDAQKSFEDQDYTSDDHIQGFQKEYALGARGDKYKMQAHLLALARDDSLPGLMKAMGKNFTHEDYIQLLKSMKSMSEREILQFTASMDKVNKSVKQLSLTNSVERVGGALQYRSEERHNYERMKALDNMTLGEIVKLPKTALADVTRGVDGSDLYSVHEEVYKALEDGAKTKNADKFFRERISNSRAQVFLASDKVQAWATSTDPQLKAAHTILTEKASRIKK